MSDERPEPTACADCGAPLTIPGNRVLLGVSIERQGRRRGEAVLLCARCGATDDPPEAGAARR